MAPSETPAALRVRGLRKSFGDLVALDGLDLDVARGEAIGLLGPNGAGKTTTLRMLSTLTASDAGEMRILGLDPRTEGDALRARLGVVPQEIALYDDLTAFENLEFFGRMMGVPRARLKGRCQWGLEVAGLADRTSSRVGTFSGGMKRRLNLVAALLHEPELLFLDEPTAGVDPQSRNHIFEMVEQLHREGLTFLYTTHQMGEVERLCDRIVILDRGSVVADGSQAELRELDAVRQALGHGLSLPKDADLQHAASVLREAGIEADVRGPKADLEQIFLALTGRALRDKE